MGNLRPDKWREKPGIAGVLVTFQATYREHRNPGPEGPGCVLAGFQPETATDRGHGLDLAKPRRLRHDSRELAL